MTLTRRPRRRGSELADFMDSENVDVDTRFVIDQLRELNAGLIRCANMLVTSGEVIWCAKLPDHEGTPCAGIRHNGDIRQWEPARGTQITRSAKAVGG